MEGPKILVILTQLNSVIREVIRLKGEERGLTQVERIMLSRLKKRLAHLKKELEPYINPVIYEVSFLNGNDKHKTHFSNITQDLIPISLSLKYPKYKDIKILEIRELGNF